MSELQQQIDELKQRISQFETEHAEHRKSHNSRRGVEGGRGETGPVGPVGPPADVNQVAEIAAEIVKKAQIAKFQALLNELEAEVGAVKTALRWSIIEELKLSGFVDSEGRVVPGPAGAAS